MVFRPKREERSEPRGGLGVGTKVPSQALGTTGSVLTS